MLFRTQKPEIDLSANTTEGVLEEDTASSKKVPVKNQNASLHDVHLQKLREITENYDEDEVVEICSTLLNRFPTIYFGVLMSYYQNKCEKIEHLKELL